jgi:hypothetical protein
MDAGVRVTTAWLRTAKACGPGALEAGANPRVEEPGGTVTQKPVSPGRARYRPLTPSRRECRCFGFICGDYAHVLSTLAHGAAGAAKHPAFPAPSVFARVIGSRLGREAAAGMRTCVLRCNRVPDAARHEMTRRRSGTHAASVDGPRISSAPRRKRGALRSIRGRSGCCLTCTSARRIAPPQNLCKKPQGNLHISAAL